MKFSNLTYKQKNKYLLIGVIVFSILAYMITIRDTVRLYKDNSRIASKIKKAENAPMGIADLRKSLALFDDKLGNYLIDTLMDHQHTLEVVSEFCSKKKLLVKELPKRTVSTEKEFTIITSILNIEGGYTDLLLLLNELEHVQHLGRVSSVVWKSQVDSKTKRTILSMTIYLQNITINKEGN